MTTTHNINYITYLIPILHPYWQRNRMYSASTTTYGAARLILSRMSLLENSRQSRQHDIGTTQTSRFRRSVNNGISLRNVKRQHVAVLHANHDTRPVDTPSASRHPHRDTVRVNYLAVQR